MSIKKSPEEIKEGYRKFFQEKEERERQRLLLEERKNEEALKQIRWSNEDRESVKETKIATPDETSPDRGMYIWLVKNPSRDKEKIFTPCTWDQRSLKKDFLTIRDGKLKQKLCIVCRAHFENFLRDHPVSQVGLRDKINSFFKKFF